MFCLAYGGLAPCAALWLFFAAGEENTRQATDTATAQNVFPAFTMLKGKDVFLAMLVSILNAFSNDRIFTFLYY
jgi:hypothetical protein